MCVYIKIQKTFSYVNKKFGQYRLWEMQKLGLAIKKQDNDISVVDLNFVCQAGLNV